MNFADFLKISLVAYIGIRIINGTVRQLGYPEFSTTGQ